MVSRSLNRTKLAPISATDEFWHSPVINDENMASSIPSTCDHSFSNAAASDDDDDSLVMVSMPPAHHHLLSQDYTSSEALKGYDHTQEMSNCDSNDGYSTDEPSYCCRQKLSAVKQQGGGSWLLGFARLNDSAATETMPLHQPHQEDEEEDDSTPPGLLRVPSGASLESDECSSSDEDSASGDSLTSNDTPTKRRRPGVSFASTVAVQPVPHSSILSPLQRRKMFSSSFEVRQNKIRNKREYRFDGYDWRNITEEWEMGVDMVTGELVHPAHEYGM